MAWPFDRIATFATKSQIPSTFLNALQDGIRDIAKLLTAASQSTYANVEIAVPVEVTDELYWSKTRRRRIPITSGVIVNGSGNLVAGVEYTSEVHPLIAASGQQFLVEVPLDEGEQLTAIRARVAPFGASDAVQLSVMSNSTPVGTPAVSSGGTAQTLSVTGLSITAGNTIGQKVIAILDFDTFNAGFEVIGLDCLVARPAP